MPRNSLGWIVVEEVRQQAWPEQRVQFITEIPCAALPAIEQHCATSPLRHRQRPPPAESGADEAEA